MLRQAGLDIGGTPSTFVFKFMAGLPGATFCEAPKGPCEHDGGVLFDGRGAGGVTDWERDHPGPVDVGSKVFPVTFEVASLR